MLSINYMWLSPPAFDFMYSINYMWLSPPAFKVIYKLYVALATGFNIIYKL